MARRILLGGAAQIAGQACERRLARSIAKPPKWPGRLALARTAFKHVCALLPGCRSRSRIGGRLDRSRVFEGERRFELAGPGHDDRLSRPRADQLENETAAAENWRRSSRAAPKGNGEQPFSAATMCRDTLRKACVDRTRRLDALRLRLSCSVAMPIAVSAAPAMVSLPAISASSTWRYDANAGVCAACGSTNFTMSPIRRLMAKSLGV
jgi:hypothetical protein